jgi:hypothetical protein
MNEKGVGCGHCRFCQEGRKSDTVGTMRPALETLGSWTPQVAQTSQSQMG